MSFVEHRSQQEKSAPLIYRFQRLFFAACIVLGTAAILVAAVASHTRVGHHLSYS